MTEARHVHIALGVGLRHAEEGDIQPAAVVEVELIGLVDHRLGVHRGAEIEAAGRDAADDAGLGGQREVVDQAFLRHHRSDAFRHAYAQIDHVARLQLECGATGDHLAQVQRHRRQRLGGEPRLARIGRVVDGGEGLVVVLRRRHDDAIDQHARYLDLARVQFAARDGAFDLHDDQTTRVVRGHRHRQRFLGQRFALHRHVAVRVGRAAAHQRDVDRKGLVEEEVLAVDLHAPHQIVSGGRVDLAAAVQRIDEGVQPDPRELARPVRGDVAEQLRDHALRQIPGLDLIRHRQRLQSRHQAPMAADHAPYQPGVAEVVEPAVLAIALAGGVDQCEVARRAAIEEALFDRDGEVFGEADADEAGGGQRGAVRDARHGFGCAHDLAAGVRHVGRLGHRKLVACDDVTLPDVEAVFDPHQAFAG